MGRTFFFKNSSAVLRVIYNNIVLNSKLFDNVLMFEFINYFLIVFAVVYNFHRKVSIVILISPNAGTHN